VTRVLLVLLFVLGVAQVSAAQTYYYIRDGGSASTTGTGACVSTGSGDWSLTNACDDVPATLVRGATYLFAEGNYAGKSFSTACSGACDAADLITFRRATAADHGSDENGWANSLGDGYWQRTGIGTGTTVNGGGVTFTGKWFIDAQYITIDGNTDVIERYGIQWSIASVGAAYMVYVGKNTATILDGITFRDFRIVGTGEAESNGLSIEGVVNTLLSNFWIHSFDEDPMDVKLRNSVIENCRLEERIQAPGSTAHGDALAFTASGDPSIVGNVTMRYCYVNWDGQMLFWDGAAGTTHGTHYVYGNIFVGDVDSKCMHVKTTNNPTLELYLYNNICVQGSGATSSTSGFHSGVTGDAKNNIFWTPKNVGYGGMTHTHNFYKSGLTVGTTESNAQVSATSPFTDIDGGDYTLAGATTCGAVLASTYDTDWNGDTRGEDGCWDRGTYEFGGGGGGPITPTVTITTPTSSTSYATGTDPLAALSGTVSGGTGITCTGTTSFGGGTFTVTVTASSFSASNLSLTNDGATTLTVTCENDDLLSASDTLTVNHTTPSGTLPAQDSFTRADSASLGGNWTSQTATVLGVTSNQAKATTAQSRQCSYWNAIALDPNHYSQAIVKTTPAVDVIHYVTVRATGTSHFHMTAEDGVALISKVIDGVRTPLLTCPGDGGCASASAIPWAIDDVMRLEANGSTLTGKRNGVSIGSVSTGGLLSAATYVGICGFGGAALDDFEGSELGQTPPPNESPVAAWTTPTSTGNYSTTATTLDIAGTCADNDGSIASVTVTNNGASVGTVGGPTTWSKTGITLAVGLNRLVATCTDDDAAATVAQLDVIRLGDETVEPKYRLRVR
jgi:hypothetical protein